MRAFAPLVAVAGLANAAAIELPDLVERQAAATTSVPAYFQSGEPQYFQTTPELFAGPTPTGEPAFLAETNPAPFPATSYVPPQPLETQVPIQGAEGRSIYHLHGQLSHYFPNPDGFGVDEYALPSGTNITKLFMLSRHGARYPTGNFTTVGKIQNATGHFNATGQLSFLNNWTYKLGQQILVPIGKQELFDSGTLHQYMYGHLYPNNGSKIIARAPTQDRMIQSAEYFLAGFFGLHWPDNATLEVIIEQQNFNSSLSAYYQCNNSNTGVSAGGTNASTYWQNIYLANATTRINKQITGLNFSVSDVYTMQSLCAYETVALGYSAFCDLFTYEEWEGYEYSVDLSFVGNNAFQSPTGRAVGIAWVDELLARLEHHYITTATDQVNYTLDSSAATFPLDQALNFDFSHDTNIMSILTAFGLTQFAPTLPRDHIPANRSVTVSHMEPFGARLDIEIIQAPHPVNPKRKAASAGGIAHHAYAERDAAPATTVVVPETVVVTTTCTTSTTSSSSSKKPSSAPAYTSKPPAYTSSSATSKPAPSPSASASSIYLPGNATQYVHFILNQRTIPLGKSYPQCGDRDDGWCEMSAFLAATADLRKEAEYDYSCNGKYAAVPYGTITNGVPQPS